MSKKMWIPLGAVLLVIAILVSVYVATAPKAQEGSKTITVEVVHADGSKKEFTYHTDELYLDKVLVAEGLIAEDNIVDGMFTTVDGETASWEQDQAYWAFYVGEEYASKGICETPVEDGSTYKLVYTK